MKTVNELAKELGVCKTTIWHHIRKNGLGERHGRSIMLLSDDDVDIIRKSSISHQRDHGGVTIKQLMDQTGLSRETIAKRVKRLGIKVEPRKRVFLTAEEAEKIREM